MAKKLTKLPDQFEELGKVFRETERPGWSIGSAEGGWITPSKASKVWSRRRKAASARPVRKSVG